jgi:hypothetical protein
LGTSRPFQEFIILPDLSFWSQGENQRALEYDGSSPLFSGFGLYFAALNRRRPRNLSVLLEVFRRKLARFSWAVL